MRERTRSAAVGLLASGLLLVAACDRPDSTVDEQAATMPAPTRSDSMISTEIQARFYGDDAVRGQDLDVRVTDGMVALEGTVDNAEARQQAESLAQAVEGVRAVENRIEIAGAMAGTQTPADQQTASADRTPADAGQSATPHPPRPEADASTNVAAGSERAMRAAAEEVSAAWITAKIQSQYFIDDDVRGLDIDVTTTDTGVVTLEGEVSDAAARDRAQQIAQTTEGVRRVENRLRLEGQTRAAQAAPAAATATQSAERQPTGGQPADKRQPMDADTPTMVDAEGLEDVPVADNWITMKIQSKYFLDGDVAARRIDVSTRDGVVTLRGQVENERQHRQALALARTTDGVQSVTDELQVGAAEASRETQRDRSVGQVVDDTWVTTKIQSKYFLDEDIKGRDVDVTSRDGVVTLTGTVADSEARQTAEAIAMETDGVLRVVNRLTIGADSGTSGQGDEEPGGDMPRD